MYIVCNSKKKTKGADMKFEQVKLDDKFNLTNELMKIIFVESFFL